MWVFLDENQPVKFKRNRSASQQTIVHFFAKSGHVATISLEERQPITADWCVSHCLPNFFLVCCTRRPRPGVHGLLLHHEKAQHAHISCNSWLSIRQWCSACYLSTIYTRLRHLWLVSVPFRQEAVEGKAVPDNRRCPSNPEGVHFDIPQSTWWGVMDSWFKRMVQCVQAEEGFFQKLE